MSDIIKWQGSAVDVQARLVPRFCWLTASIDVFLNDLCILRTVGSFKFTGSSSSTFTHSGSTHTAELTWGISGFRSFPYKLRIDGTSVSDARVYVRNWPAAYVAGAFIGVLLGAFVLLILYLVHHT